MKSIINKDNVKLSGAQKVAITLLSLSDEYTTKLFALMSEDEVTNVSHVMSNLGEISKDIVDSVIEQLTKEITADTHYLGDVKTTETLLAKVLDKETASHLIDEIKGSQGRNTWDKLNHIDAKSLAYYFGEEHPQAIALILSKIAPNHAAEILGQLSDELALDVILRVQNLKNVNNDFTDRIECTLKNELINNISRNKEYNSIDILAEVFNNFDRVNENKFMVMLESSNSELAKTIKSKRFMFDDLVKIEAKGIRHLLNGVDRENLTLALKGASSSIKRILFSNMSQRIVRIIEEDLVSLGAVRIQDVDIARSKIVKKAKNLLENSEIHLKMNSVNKEFII